MRRCVGFTIITTILGLAFAAGQQPPLANIFRESFETGGPMFRPGVSDSPYQEVALQVDDKVSHSGQHSAFLRLIAKPGTHIYYWYPVPKADIVDDLKVSLWVRANRPVGWETWGIQAPSWPVS